MAQAEIFPNISAAFWAKTYKIKNCSNDEDIKTRSVPHHMLDVAAAAFSFLEHSPRRCDREAAALGFKPEAYKRLCAFLAGLHDLGKFSRSFQKLCPKVWPKAVLGAMDAENVQAPRHWRLTAILLMRTALRQKFVSYFPNQDCAALNPIVSAIAGHHGSPPDWEDLDFTKKFRGAALDETCIKAACEAMDLLAGITAVQPAYKLDDKAIAFLSWRLAGLITLSDWIGSDTGFFGANDDALSPRQYWEKASAKARAALAHKGLTPQRASHSNLAALSARAGREPRPMQLLCGQIVLNAGPALFLIEDATGSGKTEAALLLASRLMRQGSGEGIFLALPTMATANGIYARLNGLNSALFEQEKHPASLVLAHGKAQLAQALARLEGERAIEPGEVGEKTSVALCNAWIADDRRRAFFADLGVATIDQAFIAILSNKKHVALRQYALAGRILIIDEAHSYDPYMQEELAVLLQLHAANGGSAIILSATLPLARRQKIVKAFRDGVDAFHRFPRKKGHGDVAQQSNPCSMGYPLLTCCDETGLREDASDFDIRLEKPVRISRLESLDAAYDAILTAADQGAAVLFIRNAVDETIAAARALRERLGDPERVDLFHARFAQIDRVAIEERVLQRFGREAGARARAGRILVASQVVEQSLDLDFDLIVTDLAPIDLLIQRAGRLWRHLDVRPPSARALPEARLLIVSPDPNEARSAAWLEPLLGKGAGVYRIDVMWRSACEIFARACLPDPHDIRASIESVYGATAKELPECLVAAASNKEGQAYGQATQGIMNTINLIEGYSASGLRLAQGASPKADQEIGTRLGEETHTLRLARRIDGDLRAYCQNEGLSEAQNWALSEINVRKKFWSGKTNRKKLEMDRRICSEDKTLHAIARKDWPEWEQNVLLAEILPDGRLRLTEGGLTYSADKGLEESAPQQRG